VPSIWKKGRPTLVCQFWGDCATHKQEKVSNGALMVQGAGIWRVQFVGVQAHLEDEVVERVADLGVLTGVRVCTRQAASVSARAVLIGAGP